MNPEAYTCNAFSHFPEDVTSWACLGIYLGTFSEVQWTYMYFIIKEKQHKTAITADIALYMLNSCFGEAQLTLYYDCAKTNLWFV